MLGVRNSSVFLSNCTIWVEGITDRLYIKKYLELYLKGNKELKVYQEDIHFSFVEYAGSNITHWNFDNENKDDRIFADSISNKIFLIADSDKTEAGEIPKAKQKHFAKLKQELGDNFCLLECKEIENLLSGKIIKGVVAKYEKENIENIEIKNIEKINKKPYINMNIGKFIDNNFENKKRNYSANNTISDKVQFCNRAIEVMDKLTFEDLSEQAKEVSEKIYKFIEKSNKF